MQMRRWSPTVCNRLTPLFVQPVLQDFPVIPRGLVIRLLDQRRDDVHHGEIPGFGSLLNDALYAIDEMATEDGQQRLEEGVVAFLSAALATGSRTLAPLAVTSR
jgi:hypothetical protein